MPDNPPLTVAQKYGALMSEIRAVLKKYDAHIEADDKDMLRIYMNGVAFFAPYILPEGEGK